MVNVRELCTVLVVGRDKFSPTEKCLEYLIKNTPENPEILVILGGVPQWLQKQHLEKFGSRVKFNFYPDFLSQPEERNIGLKLVKTKLAAIIDNDVFVRPNWLTPLVQCQVDTQAPVVAPIILEEEKIIHTAINALYQTYKGGKAYCHKELGFHSTVFEESCDLKRTESGFAELHCMLVDVQTALKISLFDNNMKEATESDSALTVYKNGYKIMFEPKSVVHFQLYHPVRAYDIEYFCWRWDMKRILEGYKIFEKKWGFDMTEHARFSQFLVDYNSKVGLWGRLFKSGFGLFIDKAIAKFGPIPGELFRKHIIGRWRLFLANRLGYGEWVEYHKQNGIF